MSCHIVDSLSSVICPSAPPLCGSLTTNISSKTHSNPRGGVMRKAHLQSPNAAATFEPTM